MNERQKALLLESIVESLELPDSAYKTAKARSDDIGDWFNREGGLFKDNEPHIFPQGSFRLGTAIYPIDEKKAYDFDLACELQERVTRNSHTQQLLKSLIGKEIEAYRIARGIKAPKEEKHRCWCLNYAKENELSFHMDIVPCIPADELKSRSVFESMKLVGESALVADAISKLTVSITDDRHPRYAQICDDWLISNPEGYAKWFEFRMKQAEKLLKEKVALFEAENIDALPAFMWKTPLQRCVQILKRHRDQMFKEKTKFELKPISVVITTLAARAYTGEADLNEAMQKILSTMGQFVNENFPKVPNPVNPKGEDFAEKWKTDQRLEKSFWDWLQQAQYDFQEVGKAIDAELITGQVIKKYSINLNESDLRRRLGLEERSANGSLKFSGPIIVDSKPAGRHFVC
jgi:hypothetical protein